MKKKRKSRSLGLIALSLVSSRAKKKKKKKQKTVLCHNCGRSTPHAPVCHHCGEFRRANKQSRPRGGQPPRIPFPWNRA